MNRALFGLGLSALVLTQFNSLAAAPSLASDWPQWRGPQRDGHVSDGVALPTTLPCTLKPLWKISVGGGFSAPIIAGNKLVYLDENGTKELAHAIDITTGKPLWHIEFAERFQDE